MDRDTYQRRRVAWTWLLGLPLVSGCALLPPTGIVAMPAPERRAEGSGERISRNSEGDIVARTGYWVDGGGNEVRHGLQAQYWPDGSPKALREFDHGIPSGWWKTFWQDGGVRSDHQIVPGQATAMKYFHPNGKLASEGKAIAGQRVGPWKYWFASGVVSEEGVYVGGKRDGLWQAYEEDGALREEVRYLAGRRVAY